jgi:hypothetical protein
VPGSVTSVFSEPDDFQTALREQLGPDFLLREESGAQLTIAFHRAEERTGP